MANITVEQAKQISALERADGRLYLSACLGWDLFDEEDDLRKGILLDYLYDSLMYTVEKGLPWSHICYLFELAKCVQEESIGKSLTEAVKIYSTKCNDVSPNLNEESVKKYTEFFFTTFMTHHKLYQYVFTHQQAELKKEVDVSLSLPVAPQPFSEAQEVAVYEYEKKMAAIEEAEGQKKDERIKEKREIAERTDEIIKESYGKVEQIEAPLTQDKLVEIIHEVATAHITAASHTIKANIEETIDDLQFMLEKTALPRPQLMASGPFAPMPNTPRVEEKGQAQAQSKDESSDQSMPMQALAVGRQSPPPRHKNKTPLPAKRPNSKNPDSRDKSS